MLMNGLKHGETAAILFTGEMDDGRKVRVVVRPRYRFMGGFVEGEAARWVRMVRTVRFDEGVNTFGLVQRGTGKASTWVTTASDVHVVSGRDATRVIHAAIDAWVPVPWCDDVVETSVELDDSVVPACVGTTDSAGVRRCYLLDDARVEVLGLREFVALLTSSSGSR